MDNVKEEPESEDISIGVFELPGEPAIVINGVPEVGASDDCTVVATNAVNCGGEGGENNTSAAAGFFGNGGFGEWLVGREVMKLFGGRYYNGTVTQFDNESGWYRVVYEDGDSEDLDWNELESVLLPLDISVPLRSLALKVLVKKQKSVAASEKSVKKQKSVDSSEKSATKTQNNSGRRTRSKGKKD